VATSDLTTGARSGRTWEVKTPVKIAADTRDTQGKIASATDKGLALARERLLAKARADYRRKLAAYRARQAAWERLRAQTSSLLNPGVAPKPGYELKTLYVVNPDTGVREKVTRWVPTQYKTLYTDPIKAGTDRDENRMAALNRQLVAQGVDLKNYYSNELIKKQAQTALDLAKAKGGTAEAGAALEAVVQDIAKLQKSTKGAVLDSTVVTEVYKAYQQHVTWVSAQYRTYLDKIKALYKQDDKGNLIAPKSEDASFEIESIQSSKEFKAIEGEYMRLYSGGTQVPKAGVIPQGTVAIFQQTADEIGQFQRELLYQFAKKTVFNKAMTLRKHGELDEAARIVADWKNGGQYLDDSYSDVAKSLIDPEKTSWVYYTDPDTGKREKRQRSVEEEYAYRRAQYTTRLQSEYLKAKQMQDDYLAEQRENNRLNRDQLRAEQDVYAATKTLNLSRLATRDDIKKTVETALATWEENNRHIFFSDEEWKSIRSGLGLRNPALSKRYNDFLRARSTWEQRYYTAAGGQKDGVLETVVQLPVIKQGLDVLGAGFGAIGSAIKYGATVASGAPAELIMAGDNLNYDLIPPDQQALVQARERALLQDPAWLRAHSLRGSNDRMRATWARQQAMHEVIKTYIQSDEGDAWAQRYGQTVGGFGINTGRSASDRERIYNDLSNFYQKFNVQFAGQAPVNGNPAQQKDILGRPSANLLDAAAALTEYGSLPFSPDSWQANLIAGFALDPFVKLPLKVTTWGQRLEHAVDVTQGTTGLRRTWMGAKDWLNVSESDLRYAKYVKEVKALKVAGATEEEVRAHIYKQMAGTKDKTLRKSMTELLLQESGFTRLDKNYQMAMSLAEHEFNTYVKTQKIPTITLAKQVADEQAAREAAKAAADQAATDVLVRESRNEAKRQTRLHREAQNARGRTAARREQQIATATQRVEREANLAKAAQEISEEAKKATSSAERVANDVEHARVVVAEAAEAEAAKTARAAAGEAPAPHEATAETVQRTVTPESPAYVATPRLTHESGFTFVHNIPFVENTQAFRDFNELHADRVNTLLSEVAGKTLTEKEARAIWERGFDEALAREQSILDTLRGATHPESVAASERAAARKAEILKKIAEGPKVDKRVGATPGARVPRYGHAVTEQVQIAKQIVAEYSARSIAEATEQLESVGFREAMERGELVAKKLPSTRTQYIPRQIEASARHGVHGEGASRYIANERRIFENAKREIVRLRKSLMRGKLTPEAYRRAAADRVQTVVAEVRGWDLDALQTGDPVGIMHRISASDDISGGFAQRVGQQLIEDLEKAGAEQEGHAFRNSLRTQYQTFSMLPGRQAFAQGKYLAAILDPKQRLAKGKMLLTRILAETDVPPPGGWTPTAFAEYGQQVFMLFHLSRFEGGRRFTQMRMTVARTLVDNPDNMMARLWRVMEARAGLPTIEVKETLTAVSQRTAKVAGTAPEEGVVARIRGLQERLPKLRKTAEDAEKYFKRAEAEEQAAKARKAQLEAKLEKRPDDVVEQHSEHYTRLHDRMAETRAAVVEAEEQLKKMLADQEELGKLSRRRDQLSEAIAELEGGLHPETIRKLARYRPLLAELDDQIAKLDAGGTQPRLHDIIEHKASYSIEIIDEPLSIIQAERQFMETALRAGQNLHPALALGQIPYGPLARDIPSGWGWPRRLAGLGDVTHSSDLVMEAPVSWLGHDEIPLQWMDRMARGVSGLNDPKIAIRRATQIIHAIITQYGTDGIKRRADFMNKLHDYTIKVWSDLGRPQGVEFFPGRFHFIQDVRGLVDDEGRYANQQLYWAGLRTHKNPGLHTLQFLFALAQPEFAGGKTWAALARVYWKHMAGAGFHAEARELISTLFAKERAVIAESEWEFIHGGRQVNATGLGTVPTKYPDDIELFRETGLLVGNARSRAEHLARSAQTNAEREFEELGKHNENILEDHAERVRGAPTEVFERRAYTNADLDGNIQQIATLIGWFKGATPPNLHLHERARVIRKALVNELVALAKKTLDEGFSSTTLDGLEELVTELKTIPHWKYIINDVEQIFGTELWASRLGDAIGLDEARKLYEETRQQLERESAAFARETPDPAIVGHGRKQPPTAAELNARDEAAAVARQEKAAADAAAAAASTAEEIGVHVPTPEEVNPPHLSVASRALEILSGMSEEDWVKRELLRARRLFEKAPKGKAGAALRVSARRRIEDAERTLQLFEFQRTGKSFVPPLTRVQHMRRVETIGAKRAIEAFAPNNITWWIGSVAGAPVEMGRALRRRLLTATLDPELGRVQMAGDVSQHYVTHQKALDAFMNRAIPDSFLRRFDMHAESLHGITYAELFSDLDEIRAAIRNPEMRKFLEWMKIRVSKRLGEIVGDEAYHLDQYMQDILTGPNRANFYDFAEWEKHEAAMARAIRKARGDKKSNLLVRLRRPEGYAPSSPQAEVLDRDIAVIRAKIETARELGTSVARYNEMRAVYNRDFMRRRYSLGIFYRAQDAAVKEIEAAGHAWGSEGFKKAYEMTVSKHYNAERARWAATTAKKLLGQLAGENETLSPEAIIRMFEERYTPSRDLKKFDGGVISPFQKRSLEHATKHFLGVDDLDNVGDVKKALRAHGQGPPEFNHRTKMRNWFTDRGIWTPRTREQIEAGHISWGIDDEAEFFWQQWGDIPEWSQRERYLDRNDIMGSFIHDKRVADAFMEKWGWFVEDLSGQFRPGARLSRSELARELAEGNKDLGRLPKRDVALERKFLFERLGDIVGKPDRRMPGGVRLHALPWLMTPKEFEKYFVARGLEVADDIVRNEAELAAAQKIIRDRLEPYVKALMKNRDAAKPLVWADSIQVIAEITKDLLNDTTWHGRRIDGVGSFFRGLASLQRRLVFTMLGFGITNAVDSRLKSAWYRFSARSFMSNGEISAKAMAHDLISFGIESSSTLLTDEGVYGAARVRRGLEGSRIQKAVQRLEAKLGRTPTPIGAFEEARMTVEQRGSLNRLLDMAVGFSELPADVARFAEDSAKLNLARSMYDEIYRRSLKEFGDEVTADIVARGFIQKELKRLWPTVGNGPIERLLNTFFPFMSYRWKNKMLYLGELAEHPFVFNYLQRIGDAIEQYNRQQWAEDHDPETEPLPDALARLIRLPWAPDSFIDLGVFTDASRGLKPAFKNAEGPQTIHEHLDQWAQIVSPNTTNIVLGIMNAFHIYGRTGWEPVKNAAGYPTGEYREVEVPWDAPWGGTADALNSIWPIELWRQYVEFNKGGMDPNEASQLAAKLLFFGGVKTWDKVAGYKQFYYALQKVNPDAAKAWLDSTIEGSLLKLRWAENRMRTVDIHTPRSLKELMDPSSIDENGWFHERSLEYQNSVKAAFDGLKAMQLEWDHKISRLTPGSPEYQKAKMLARLARYNYFGSHPELYEAVVLFQTPEEWEAEISSWVTDDLLTSYFNIRRPDRVNFKDELSFQTAVRQWKERQAQFLKAFPAVAQRLNEIYQGEQGIWRDHEQHWWDVFESTGIRKIAITAAQESKNFELADQLYLVSELEYQQLLEDTLVFYYDPTTDFVGDELRKGPYGQSLVPLVKILPDFNSWRYSRMTTAEKMEYERDQKYREGLGDIIALARASDNFGATFVAEMKKHPDIMREYFRLHPGKQDQWEANDAYIKAMQGWGRLIKAGRWGEAQAYFASLDPWMRARYYAKHPEKRKQMEENIAYTSYMEKWTAFYRRRDYAGGAAYFASLPAWVRERFYSNNPDGQTSGSSGYAKAMGKWVALLQDGKRDEAKAYFDSLPQAYKDRYYAKHPMEKLKTDILRMGQLQQYFAADDANRVLYLQNHPEFARWMAQQDDSESRRRMLILAAYQTLPKDDQWLRRIFREKYPEIFSQEAKGLARLSSVFDKLADHPDLVDDWQRWVEHILNSYGDMLKHGKAQPKPIEFIHPQQRTKKRKAHGGESAAWVRFHSVA
jgi:hypothetical protein